MSAPVHARQLRASLRRGVLPARARRALTNSYLDACRPLVGAHSDEGTLVTLSGRRRMRADSRLAVDRVFLEKTSRRVTGVLCKVLEGLTARSRCYEGSYSFNPAERAPRGTSVADGGSSSSRVLGSTRATHKQAAVPRQA